MIEDSWGVNDLESEIVELCVTDEECLCCEGIRLNFNIGSADAVNET